MLLQLISQTLNFSSSRFSSSNNFSFLVTNNFDSSFLLLSFQLVFHFLNTIYLKFWSTLFCFFTLIYYIMMLNDETNQSDSHWYYHRWDYNQLLLTTSYLIFNFRFIYAFYCEFYLVINYCLMVNFGPVMQ